MEQIKKLLKLLFKATFLLPLILGTAGFIQMGNPILDALFMSVTLYTLNYGDGGNVLLVEIARWLAPVVTASGLMLVLSQVHQHIRQYWLYKRGLAVAVYGSGSDAARLLDELGSCGIEGGDRFVRAQKYILAGDESFNLEFYNRHREQLAHSSVYLKCSSLPAQASAPANLRLYCPEETAARLFWQRGEALRLSQSHDYNMDIVIVGFGLLGEQLLTTGLQQNIFSPRQRIAYHIFGDDNGFAATHPRLKEISDPVIFHDGPWYEDPALLNNAAMVIVAEQEAQTALVEKLLLTLTRDTLHIFTAESFGLEILDEQSRMELFRWEQSAANPDVIFSTKLYEDAMQLNLAYAVRYSDNPGTAEEEWAALNGFTRYSNISSADYFKVLCSLLRICGQPDTFAQLSPEWKELLSELEHIRWCRYHYLNNWSYGIPANGKAKDAAKRIHRSLVPYETLTKEEQAKDLDNIALMFELAGK